MELKSYVAFLRGINVAGKKKVSMESLKALCDNLGLKEVRTYIQSGNILFKNEQLQTDSLAGLLADAIQKKYGFQVPVLVKTVSQVKKILDYNPFDNEEDLVANKIYFVLLNEVPTDELLTKFKADTFENEEYFVAENCMYLKCNLGYGKAKLNNNLIERKLKVSATTRNFRTISKLVALGS
ncbi:DUF1697 domain-containing protein [Maribacter sp. ACAM166]|uniref:DUF1697 domain-containing protein n=1 Tax=Maribacter sp. ACAM166 TaxID=2508996 RepID=UPI0010FDC10C|nr:DUF1697 domain-containing protein [Maribacter sp. ACAM166]TLP82704.1 DUF1697 domain-containing protein [Maribacter sp. ACAM166]